MKVCQCDRCGKIFEPHMENRDFWSRVIQVGEETFNLTDCLGEIETTYDICDDCFADFQRWLKRGKIKGEK